MIIALLHLTNCDTVENLNQVCWLCFCSPHQFAVVSFVFWVKKSTHTSWLNGLMTGSEARPDST